MACIFDTLGRRAGDNKVRRFLMDNRRIAVRQDEDNKAYLRPEHPAEEAAPVEERYSHLHGVSMKSEAESRA